MKKIAYCTLAAAGLMGLASCSSDDAPVLGGDGVNITVRLPRGLETRASFGDGDAADCVELDNLEWTVFEIVDNQPVKVFSGKKDGAFASSQTEETLTLPLAKGKTYQVAFYADDKDNGFVSYSDGVISVDYNGVPSNTAAQDAFIGKSEVFTVSGAYNAEVTLTRPFAQLNWGTDDVDAEVLSEVVKTLKANVTVSQGLYKEMNVISGDVSAPVEEVVFGDVLFSALPAQTFPVEGNPAYSLIAMNYLLTGNGVIDCELTLTEGLSPVVVNAVPVQVNHRTNIYGSLLTAPGKFEIKVDNNFDEPANNVKIVTTAGEFADAIAAGGNIEIPANAVVNLEAALGTPSDTPSVIVTKETSLEVKGKLVCKSGGQVQVKAPLHISGNGSITGGLRGCFYVTEGGSLDAESVSFNSTEAYRGGDVWNEGGGSMTFTDVTFNSNMASVYFQPATEEDTLTMTGCIVNNTSRNSIINPETGEKVWSYAIRVQGGKAVLSDMTVNGIQGGVAVGRGAVCDIKSGTYTVNDSEPGKGDGFYALYVARDGVANVYGGNFSALRPAVFNGNEDNPGDHYGFINLYGGKYSSKGVNQSGEDFKLPAGYRYEALTGQDPYTWEVVKE